jgi:hypothetical protein
MAGDWIKWTKGLTRKREVLLIASALNKPAEEITGRLMLLWEWCDDNVTETDIDLFGNALVTLGAQQNALIDALTGAQGFADAMQQVGWLRYENCSLTFPNFTRHNGKTAKTRALTQVRVQRSRNGAVTPKPLPEKKRKEKITNTNIVSPDLFEEFWAAFPTGRKKSKGTARDAFAKAVAKCPPATIIASAKEYAASEAGRGPFVKMPATWLNQECWQDDREAWKDRDAAAPPKPKECIELPFAEFKALKKAQKFLGRVLQDSKNPQRYFGQLYDGRKVETFVKANA